VHRGYMKKACKEEGRGLDFISQSDAQRLLNDVAVTGAAYDVYAHARAAARPPVKLRPSPSTRAPRGSSSGSITQQFFSSDDGSSPRTFSRDADERRQLPEVPYRRFTVREEHARKYDLHEQRERKELTELQQYRRHELKIFDPEDAPITSQLSRY